MVNHRRWESEDDFSGDKCGKLMSIGWYVIEDLRNKTWFQKRTFSELGRMQTASERVLRR